MTSNRTPDDDMPMHGLVPGRDERARFRNVHVTPDLGDAYSFNIVLPVDWGPVNVPPVPGINHIGARFTGIGIFSPVDPPMPPIILSIGVRIPEGATTVVEQFELYCKQEGYEIIALRPQRYAAGNVVEGLILQEASPVGPMKMRMAMFDDGGRLFGISGMAPEALYADFVRDLSLAMLSFELSRPQGPQMPLAPE